MSARARSRAGLTFLETVAATALLGVVAATMAGVMGFLSTGQAREQQILGAHEIANRLVLMYLDDPLHMPEGGRSIPYGVNRFHWDFEEQPIALYEAHPEGRERQRNTGLVTDRFACVTVRAWLAEDSGGSRVFRPDVPRAVLTRWFDPLFVRNPDSYDNAMRNPEAWKKLMDRLMGFDRGSSNRRPGNPAGPTPR